MYLIDNLKKFFKETYINNKTAARRFVLSAPLCVLLVGLVLSIFGVSRYWHLYSLRKDQNMASYWSIDSTVDFRHMSVFAHGSRADGETSVPLYIGAENSLKRSDIIIIRNKLQDAADTGITAAGKGGLAEDGSPQGWEDCFSSFLMGEVASIPESESVVSVSETVEAQIIGVEGNFTAFHPFAFESGGFIPQEVIDTRVIVLNNNLAWRFFRSYDVVGRKVLLWGQEFTVIGVVSEPSDSLAGKTGSEDLRAYVHFAALEVYANSSTTGMAQDVAIMCYEAMLPELVRGVARTDILNALPTYNSASPQLYVLSNTGRFGVDDVFKYMWPIGHMATELESYEFPFWEKAAILTTSHMFASMIVAAVGFVFVIIAVIMFSLKTRKMSPKRNIRSSTYTYNT